MSAFRKSTTIVACGTVLLISGYAAGQDNTEPSGSFGERFNSGSSSAESQRAKKEAVLPRCSEPVGSVAIVPPEKNWWSQVQLQSPEALIKMFVARSGCFTIVDRGRGAAIAERERALAGSGNLQRGSNIGGGQMRAADYVITPDIVVSNNNAGGSGFGALFGALIPGIGGVIASSIRMTDKSADVTLTVTDVRTTEQIVMAEGKAQKTDIGFGIGGGAFMGGGFGAMGAGSYENTALGQVVAMAYLDAYSQMVEQIQSLRAVVHPIAEPLPTPPPPVEKVVILQPPPPPAVVKKPDPVATARKGTMYREPSEKSSRIRDIPPGTILYPTTNTSGFWWEVTDSSGEKGWIRAGTLQLGQ